MNATLKKLTALSVAAILSLSALPAHAEDTLQQPELVARVKNIIEADGYSFKDLNDNGVLDPYEDWRLSAQERTEDLLSQMTPEQKAAQMVHLTLVSKKDGWFSNSNVGFALIYEYAFDSAADAAQRTNEIQELSEASELGIPVVFSMDTEEGAANDAALVAQLNTVLKEELKAVGIRMALSPDADLITDPRWGRNQECYSEDTEVVQRLIAAAVQALQGGAELSGDSVIATIKHFPGAGAQTGGVDGTPLTIQEDSLELHLAGFKAGIAAGAAAVMPYGYSTVPMLGGDAVDNSADQSAVVMTDLLRGQLGYTGIIQTDWGLNFVGATNAGADILGGMGVRSSTQLVDEVDEERLTDACRRILNAKFQLGIFENPYVDEDAVYDHVGTAEHKAVAKEAAARSFTLVKYDNAAPLTGQKIVVAGSLAQNIRALNSGWTAKEPIEITGTTILDALTAKAGADNVTYVETAADVPADLSGTTAIVVVGEKSGTHDPEWTAASLEFPQEQTELVQALKAEGANVVSVVIMNRAYVLTPISDASDSVLLVYRPGITCGAEAVADALFGETAITGKLPFQIPADMEQVLNQREDMPKDIENPLYDYGFGIETESFGA